MPFRRAVVEVRLIVRVVDHRFAHGSVRAVFVGERQRSTRLALLERLLQLVRLLELLDQLLNLRVAQVPWHLQPLVRQVLTQLVERDRVGLFAVLLVVDHEVVELRRCVVDGVTLDTARPQLG